MNLVFASGFLVPQHILGINYFGGVEDRLRGRHETLFADVPALDTSERRAGVLADLIQQKFPQGEVHIIAHSMGGLDSRTLIGRNLNGLSAPGRIASLTTLSTPHRGSPVADLLVGAKPHGLRRLVYETVSHALGQLSVPVGALGDLTADGAARIPDVATSHPHIRYRSCFASGRPEPFLPTSLVLAPTYHYIHSVTGQPNDGVVALDSARYGEFQEPFFQCDHVDMVGHNLDTDEFSDFRFDHLAAIEGLISQL
ncbi:MAG: triacylglycerol lipase [Alphaproteobacteria bacterium]|jgi:triacylglycerol lipase|nr:triacylglycerol lipase [Alphaproteobacteria bacterium]